MNSNRLSRFFITAIIALCAGPITACSPADGLGDTAEQQTTIVCNAGATQTCNGTGTQVCSNNAWGVCSVGATPTVCTNGATQTCNGTGTQVCSNNAWGACSVSGSSSGGGGTVYVNTSTDTGTSEPIQTDNTTDNLPADASWACIPVGTKMYHNGRQPLAGQYFKSYLPQKTTIRMVRNASGNFYFDYAGHSSGDVRWSYGSCTGDASTCWSQYGGNVSGLSTDGRRWLEGEWTTNTDGTKYKSYGCRAYFTGSSWSQNAGI